VELDAVFIDYGHGGVDEHGDPVDKHKQYHFENDDGDVYFSIYEGLVNREVAWRLIRLLLFMDPSKHIEVYDAVARKKWTREYPPSSAADLEQRNVSLQTRTDYSNAFPTKGTLFPSLHSNAMTTDWSGPGQPIQGVAFFTSPGQTLSDKYATHLDEVFRRIPVGLKVRRGEWTDGDVDIERDFWVLRKTRGAAVLGEVGFYDNLEDARFLASAEGQSRIAFCYATALLELARATAPR